MASRSLIKRVERLEAAAGPGMIVYEASDETSKEERQEFLKQAVGEIPPETLVVCILRFFSPGMPPRLISGPDAFTRPHPTGVPKERTAPSPTV